MPTQHLIGVLSLVLAASCTQQAPNQSADSTPRGGPDVVTSFDEARMNAAMAEAKANLPTFIKALNASQPETTKFGIKKGFPTPDGQLEYLWLSQVEMVEGGFHAVVDNKPVNKVGVKLGQTLVIPQHDVADWMFTQGKKLVGGYSIAALIYGTPEQADFERQLGMDFTQYQFLQADD